MAITLRVHKHLDPAHKAQLRRQIRGRKKIAGTPDRPRLVVTKTAKHTLVQVIDDEAGRTLAAASTMEAALRAATGDKSAKLNATIHKLVGRPGGAPTPSAKENPS